MTWIDLTDCKLCNIKTSAVKWRNTRIHGADLRGAQIDAAVLAADLFHEAIFGDDFKAVHGEAFDEPLTWEQIRMPRWRRAAHKGYVWIKCLMPQELSPCIAIVGPANAGKTTLLHELDERLQQRLRAALVIKGNPDGTGRYLFHSPDLRESLKDEVKGKWGADTVERICEWIGHGRRNLEIALLDFGGKHNPITIEC